ncbi:MAG TPA: hypothetical protein VGI12_06905 [Vicinamibacterales bacterium]
MVVRFAVAGALIVAAAAPMAGQKTSVADVAKQMSGAWTIDLALSPAFAPARGNGGRRGGAAFAISASPLQRGGRGGGGGGDTPSSNDDLTPAELAERGVMMQLRQIAPRITIAATAETFSITDERGQQTCDLNDKGQKVQMSDVAVTAKCHWDKDKLRQEFSATRSKLIRVWNLDEAGRLVMKGKLEGMNQNTPEATAVFQRNDKDK